MKKAAENLFARDFGGFLPAGIFWKPFMPEPKIGAGNSLFP